MRQFKFVMLDPEDKPIKKKLIKTEKSDRSVKMIYKSN